MNASVFSRHIRDDRAVIRVTGEGALAFLQNLLTTDLAEPRPAYGALLTPQGKILHDVFVVPDGASVHIDCAAPQATDLLKRLLMYRLRAKLEIVLDAAQAVAVSMSKDLPGLCHADPRLEAAGFRAIVPAGSLQAGGNYDARRIELGLGDSVQDIGSGELFVHEANLDQLHGVSFAKGCYVGQEVVSRTHHRGTARNRILPVSLSADIAHGTDISSGPLRVGTMLSRDGHAGLALMRTDRLAEISEPLKAGEALVKVRKPAWASFDLVIPEMAQ